MHPIFADAQTEATPIVFVAAATFEEAIEHIDDRERTYVRASGFQPTPGRHLLFPSPDGRIAYRLGG